MFPGRSSFLAANALGMLRSAIYLCRGYRVEGRLCCGTVEWNLGRIAMDEKQVAPQAGQVQIKADEKELQGLYSNLVMVHHHAEEFTLNFVYVFPNGTQGKLLTSVIVSPGHAKRIWRALGENVSRYEAQYGPIKESPEGTPGANIGFVQ
jgi:hypothetical protein